MRTPRLAPPVRQIANRQRDQRPDNKRLEIIDPALQEVYRLDPDTGLRILYDKNGRVVTDSPPGEPRYYYDLVTGAIEYPNDSQRYLGPVSCENTCYVFAGFSRTGCLAGCRR
jgi:hypothetical protein